MSLNKWEREKLEQEVHELRPKYNVERFTDGELWAIKNRLCSELKKRDIFK